MLVRLCLLALSITVLLQDAVADRVTAKMAEEEASMRSDIHLFPSMIFSAPLSSDAKCARDSRRLEAALANYTLWAVTMMEASSRGQSLGVLAGSTRQLGDYDECLAAESPFGSQFCLASIKYDVPRTGVQADHHQHYPPNVQVWEKLHFSGGENHYPLDEIVWGLCVPQSCNAAEMELALQRHLLNGPGSKETPARVERIRVTHCSGQEETQQRYELDVLDYTFIAVFFGLVAIMGLATGLDILGFLDNAEKNRALQAVQCFSGRRNMNALTKRDPTISGFRVEYLSGMRFLTINFLVCVHRVLNVYRGPVHNYLYVADATEKLRLTGVIHGQLFVDTCFFLAGFFLAFVELARPKGTSFGRALLLRYIRLTPPYAIMILFYASVFYKLGSGPLWDGYMSVEQDACRNYWWTNLLYINNYVPTDTLCMFHSWSLAADMHYFIAGSLLLALMRRNTRLGETLLGLWLFFSVFVPFSLTAYNHWPPMLMFYPSFMKDINHSDVFRLMYSASHNRAAPYAMGLLAGVVLHRYKHCTFRFGVIGTWSTETLAWSIGLPCLLTSVIFYDPLHKYNWLESSLYASLVPLGWGLSLFICTLGAIFGVPTVASTILMWRPFVVLSRISYCVYLVHWSFQTSSTASLRAAYHQTDAKTVMEAFGDVIHSNLAALLLYMAVEAPTRQLARLFIGSETSPRKEKGESERNGYILSPVTDSDVNSNHKPSEMVPQNF